MPNRIALGLTLSIVVACSSGGDDPADGHAPAGTPPAAEVSRFPIRIVDFDRLEAAVEKERGHALLLNFWAMWCAPCVAELPELNEVAQEYDDRGARVLAVSYDLMVPGPERETIEETVRAFLEKRGIDLPVLIYDEDDYSRVDERYALPGDIPVTLAIDASGEIVDREDGQADKARFEEMMRNALGE